MIDQNRIAALRERLHGEDKKQKPSWWRRALDFGKVAAGPLSLIVSGVTAYYSAFHFVDDVRGFAHNVPAITIDKSGVSTTGPLSLSIMNGGSRSVVVTRLGISLSISTVNEQVAPARCYSPSATVSTAYYTYKPEIVKSGESLAINLEKMEPHNNPKTYEDFWKPFFEGPPKRVAICISVGLSTLSGSPVPGDIVLDKRWASSGIDFFTTRDDFGPRVLYHKTGLDLGDYRD